MQIDFNYLNASEVMLSGKRFFYDEQFKLAIKSFILIDEYPDLIDSSVHSFLAESYYSYKVYLVARHQPCRKTVFSVRHKSSITSRFKLFSTKYLDALKAGQ